MADMGSLQLPKDHAGYGSPADSGLPWAGYFFSASALVIAVAVITGALFRNYTAYARVRALRVKRRAEHKQPSHDLLTEFSVNLLSYL